jgi:hypothetical protein
MLNVFHQARPPSFAEASEGREVTFHFYHRSGSWWLAILLLLGGCSVPVQSERPIAKPAQVTLVNRTDYTWQISLAGTGAPSIAQVEAKRTVTLDVPGGHYRIQQSILTHTERPSQPRSFSADLAAGKRYEWPLVTLQSAPRDSLADEGGLITSP